IGSWPVKTSEVEAWQIPAARSDFHDLGSLLVAQLVDLGLELLGQGLDLFLAGFQVVLGEGLVGLLDLGLLVGVAADIADGDPRLLGQILDTVGQLLPLLDGQGRYVEPNHLAVGVGRQAQVARLDRLDDVADHRRIKRPDQDLLRLRRAQVRELLERRRRAVIIDPDRIDQARVRPSGPDTPELVGQKGDALFHPVFRLEGDFFDAHGMHPLLGLSSGETARASDVRTLRPATASTRTSYHDWRRPRQVERQGPAKDVSISPSLRSARHGMNDRPGGVADPGADRIAHDRALDVALFLEVEYQNRQVVLHAHSDRGHVHDLELFAHDLLEAQVRIEHRVRVLFRVGRVDAVHSSGFQQDLDAELLSPQRRGRVGRHERASRAAGQDDDPAAAQVRQRRPADERLGNLLHADGGHEPGLAAHALKRVLQGQAVDHRGRHAHVVGGGLLDDVGAPAQLGAAEDVAATDDDGELDPARRHSGSLPGDPADLLDTDTSLAGPAEALAGELEQDSAKRRGAVVDVAVHQEFLTQQEAGCLRAREAPADRAVDGTNEWQMANDRWQMTDGR